MNRLQKLLLTVALALFASAAYAGHSVRITGGILIEQDNYQLFLGAPIRDYGYRSGYTYRTPRFIAPHHRKHRHFYPGHQIRDPLLHDYRRYRQQRHINYRPRQQYRPLSHEQGFNRHYRSERSLRHDRRQHHRHW